ncbi:unnamed protein product [Sphagnum balticum]
MKLKIGTANVLRIVLGPRHQTVLSATFALRLRTGSNGLVSATSRNFGLEESEVEARDDAVKQDADQANDADVDGGWQRPQGHGELRFPPHISTNMFSRPAPGILVDLFTWLTCR